MTGIRASQRKRPRLTPLPHMRLWFNIHSAAKYQKLQGDHLEILNFRKKVSMPKKSERGVFWDLNIHSVTKHQKILRGTLWRKSFVKSHNAKKNERGDPLVSPAIAHDEVNVHCSPAK